MNLLTDRLRPFAFGMAAIATSFGVAASQPDFMTIASLLASRLDSGLAESAALAAERSAMKAEVAPSDPEVEFEYLWPSSAGEANRWSAGVSQELPDFRKMSATRRVARAIDSLDVIQRRAAESEALYEAEQRLISLIGARRELAMLQEIHENFDSLTVSYTRAGEKGEVTILDLNKIKIEHARASAADREAQGKVAALEAEIIALSGWEIADDQLSELIDYPMYSFPVDDHGCRPEEGMMEPVVRKSARFRLLEAREKVASEKINLASKERFPKLSLGYVSKVAAMAEETAMKMENTVKMNEMIASANADCARAHMLQRQLAMLGPAVENTNNFRLLKMALEGGEISLLEYLQETSSFVDAAREYNAARLEYALVLASLARWSDK